MTTPTNVTDNPHRRGGRRRWWLAAISAALALAAASTVYAVVAHPDSAGIDEQAAARATQVMPFDLNATSHTFDKTPTGGIQQVVASDPGDQRNITLIRQHLQKEAGQFAKGDYSDPATIHGTAMPGLRELQAGTDQIQVRYEQVPAGGWIIYTASNPAMVVAIHTWFDAQTTDHAMPGMGMGR